MANDGKILGLEETKMWLRIDQEDEDELIQMLILSAENYLKNATGIDYDSENKLAKLFCLILITDWYENRELIGHKVSDKVRFTVQSMLAQLTYCEVSEDENS